MSDGLLVLTIYTLIIVWLQGHSLAVVRAIFSGERRPPPPKPLSNVGQGLRLILPTVLSYVVVGWTIFAMVASIPTLLDVARNALHDIWTVLASRPSTIQSAAQVVGEATSLVSVALLIAFACFVYSVGMARYAVEDRLTCLIQLKTNVRYVVVNLSSCFGLVVRQASLLALYAIAFDIAIAVGGTALPLPSFDEPADYHFGVLRLFLTAFAVVFGFLLYWYSSLHLFARFAIAIGVAERPGKRKHAND